MYQSEVTRYGLEIQPWETTREWKEIYTSKPIADVAFDALHCPAVYTADIAVLRDILDGGWSVVTEKRSMSGLADWYVLLSRPVSSIPDADLPAGFVEVTPDVAEYWWGKNYDVIIQLRHYWTCPSGAAGCDVGYLRRVAGEIETTSAWRYHSPMMKTIFGNSGSEIRRYFVRYPREVKHGEGQVA